MPIPHAPAGCHLEGTGLAARLEALGLPIGEALPALFAHKVFCITGGGQAACCAVWRADTLPETAVAVRAQPGILIARTASLGLMSLSRITPRRQASIVSW